jgi:ATP-dependent helicase HrpB
VSPTESTQLPIDPLRGELVRALEDGPVVVSAPTGSGKSTRVPTWCPEPVLVVEPRRVACRSLAQRVAELEGAFLGRAVGYHVRNERRARDDTRILFATPGIVLRTFDQLPRWRTVILDELHERGLETDLLLALLTARRNRSPDRVDPAAAPHLVAMSATLAGDRVAGHLGGRHLRGEGRTFPVEVRHLAPDDTMLPDLRGLESRVTRAVSTALSADAGLPGNVLVFLPGKGEIASCAAALRGHPALRGHEVLELHGGLSLREQSRAFAPEGSGGRRRVILATNVAETSVTLPGIGVVVDSGLVRQTRWYRDRGFLTLTPVAADSAEQRAGRAGRTAPGTCFRLWGRAAQLAPRTPPEVHRESLTPLVLAAAAVGERVEELPFLDPPKEDALTAARDELTALGALRRPERGGAGGLLTPRGRELFGLPLDPALGRLLIEAVDADPERAATVVEDVVDLVSALSVDRPLPPAPREILDLHANPRAADPAEDPGHCDAVATLAALRAAARGRSGSGRSSGEGEALATALRLRAAFGLPARAADLPAPERPVDRRALASVVLAADPRTVHVARRRKRHTAWAAGGPELTLARESAARPAEEAGGLEALAVLGTHAVGAGFRKMRLLATCVMPLPLSWLVAEGIGEERLGAPRVEGDRIVARVERVWAGRVLDTRDEVPRGAIAREALAGLFLAGRVFPGARERAAERLEAARLARALAHLVQARGADPKLEARTDGWHGMIEDLFGDPSEDGPAVPDLETWTRRRIAELGVEHGADLALLSPEDLLPPELPHAVRQVLDRDYPRRLELPDATYAMEYEPERRTVTLVKTSGGRKEPPPLAFLPRFGGFRVRVRHGQMLRTIRDRR